MIATANGYRVFEVKFQSRLFMSHKYGLELYAVRVVVVRVLSMRAARTIHYSGKSCVTCSNNGCERIPSPSLNT